MTFNENYHFESYIGRRDSFLIIEDNDNCLQESFEFEELDLIKDYFFNDCLLGEAMAYIGRKFGYNYPIYMGTSDFDKYKRNERINKFYRNEL